MTKYLVTQRYQSGLYPGGLAAGDMVELEDALALSINRDSPGTLTAYVEPVEERNAEPAQDRMVHKASNRKAGA